MNDQSLVTVVNTQDTYTFLWKVAEDAKREHGVNSDQCRGALRAILCISTLQSDYERRTEQWRKECDAHNALVDRIYESGQTHLFNR